MEVSSKILSDITVYMKYARFLEKEKRRETWEEAVTRNKQMHIKKYPQLWDQIEDAYKFVYDKKVLPSMRSLQFGGKAIERNHARVYNCLAEETRFLTSEGVKSFQDFESGDEILVPTHEGNWKKAKVKSYGKQPLWEMTFKRGRSEKKIWATQNHRWLLREGETTNLRKGDILYQTPNLFSDFDYYNATPEERLYWCYGYVYGDGTKVKDKEGNYKYSMVRLCGKDKSYKERFEEMGFKTSTSHSLNGDFVAYTGTYLKTRPDLKKDSFGMIRAFVAGYSDADAEKNTDKTNFNNYKSIQSSDKEHCDFIREAFEMVGLYIQNETDLTGEETNFGIRGETYKFSLANSIGRYANSSWVLSEYSDNCREEKVWCLEVEDDHSFILSGGIVTGNCAYLPIDHPLAFAETMFLLLGGTGVGYSVQKHHVEELPVIRKPSKRRRRFVIQDSIIGWADAIKVLMKAYFSGVSNPDFDFSDIRAKGTPLKTAGGKAPGSEPLKICIRQIKAILNEKEDGSQLTSLEVHDILCHIADAVLAGGIRRAAMISLFSADDDVMIAAKFGKWWEKNAQRGRANNSAVLLRHKVTEEFFFDLWKKIEISNAGEPGIYFTNDKDWGTNPCCEIALRPNQFCNLVEVNASSVESQEDLNDRVKAAAFIATLQAGYTDFHYLRPVWQRTTEKDALIGVSMTGIASKKIKGLDLKEANKIIKKENARVADIIEINKAARRTCLKPSGTTSLVLGCSSGIHAWHWYYYLRRIRVMKNEAIYLYLAAKHPELVEDDLLLTDTACIIVPQKAPENAIIRNESAMDLLNRVKHFSQDWVKPGHSRGNNTHNISATVSIKEDEWQLVGDWMWDNREHYNGLSVMPFDTSSYVQMPFEDCDKETYEKMLESLKDIDLTQIVEGEDNTELKEQLACAGGVCEIR